MTVITTTTIDSDVPVPVRDGTELRADVWRTPDGSARPVLLQRTPYDKGASHVSIHHAGLEPARAVAAGWAVVIQDVRGRFASDGTFDPFAQEAADGADTVAWLREQPWCDGRVCTYGTSYGGATQLLAAGAAPDGLLALSAIETASQYHEGWTHRGGAVQLSFLLSWAADDLAGPELARLDAGESGTAAAGAADPAALATDLRRRLRHPRAAVQHLPLTDLGALAELVPQLPRWLAHPDEDAFWRARSPRERWGAMRARGLHVGGWHDLFLEGTLETYLGLRVRAATAEARAGQRLVVGPWAHGVTGSRVGETDYGPDASQAAVDLTTIQLAFFDAVLRDRLEEIPPVRLFVMGADLWRDEDAWPPARVRPTRLHLHSDGSAATRHGDGTLRLDAPGAGAPCDTYTYDPADPVPTAGGPVVMAPALGVAGPADQRAVEERPDVLVYTSAPLTAPVELIGTIRATLWAATSAADTDWTVKLVDVFPDGRAMSVTDGMLRSRYREGLARQAPPEPGRATRYDVLVGSTALRLDAGHRLRVEVSSSNFPRFDAHPNHAGVLATSGAGARVVATQRIFHDAERPSSIDLPVASGALS